MSSARGSFVTLEGIEGAGKSTQAERLVRGLEREGHQVLLTREPGGTPLGASIRRLLLDPERSGMDPRAELLLYAADRAEHVASVIRPALERGVHVVCDRFRDATRAYQGFARGLGLALVDRADLTDLKPDLTLLYDLPARTGLERALARNRRARLQGESRFEAEEAAFHERVREGYLCLARSEPGRLRVIDATREQEAIFADTWAAVRALLDGTRRAPHPEGAA